MLEGDKFKYFGFYRAEVTQVDIEGYKEYGVVRVFIPAIMTDLDPGYDKENMGSLCYPANNPVGGRNVEGDESHVYGTVYVPRLKSWLWIFFEGGNPNKPFYMSALDIKNTMLPPENRKNFDGNDLATPHEVYTILKTKAGRTIVVADSEDVERIEITGKKRLLDSSVAEGDDASTYTIDGNQTSIIFDERSGKEKILIRTRLGDFFHIDIDEQKLHIKFTDDIHIETEKNLFIKSGLDTHIWAGKNLYTYSGKETHIKSATILYQESIGAMYRMSGATLNDESIGSLHVKSGSSINFKASSEINVKSGSGLNFQSGAATNIKSGAAVAIEGSGKIDIKAGGAFAAEGSSTATIKASGAINLYSGAIKISGAAAHNGWPLSPAGITPGSGAGSAGDARDASSSMPATTATEAVPVGERDT